MLQYSTAKRRFISPRDDPRRSAEEKKAMRKARFLPCAASEGIPIAWKGGVSFQGTYTGRGQGGLERPAGFPLAGNFPRCIMGMGTRDA
jgi:hypothetical protein